MNQQFRNILYLSDVSGTGAWRRIWPKNSINCCAQQHNLQVDYTQTPILDQNFYKGINSVTIQRWISPQQRNIVQKFLKPLCDAHSAWLVYEIDDAMHYDEIPKFNRGRQAFEGAQVQQDIKAMLQAADIITVTTDYIKDYYHRKYDLPLDKIIAIPNLLPRYLYGDRYDPVRKIDQFKKLKAKPRIGIVSSLSHYNVDDVRLDPDGKAARKKLDDKAQPIKRADGSYIWVNEDRKEVPEESLTPIVDDMGELIACIRETCKDYQWVFLGFCPKQLEDLVKQNKIEVHGGTPIMNYPSMLERLQLQAIVAPIEDIEFNRCKSFIKYMEAAALGVPLLASNCLPYSRIVPNARLFSNGEELKKKLQKLKFMSVGEYTKIIDQQWKWLNSPCKEGNFNIANFWLEDNLNIWVDLFKLRQKTLTIGLDGFIKQFEKRKEEEEKRTIFKTESGMKIMK